MSQRTLVFLTAIFSIASAICMAQTTDQKQLQQKYLRLPLQFEANQGQTDADVRFLARGAGYALYLTNSEAVLALQEHGKANRGATLRMQWANANAANAIAGEQKLGGKINYLRGKDPQGWRFGVPTFARVRYRQVYPGIDVIYYGSQRDLEYDMVVSPGADLSSVRLKIDGAEKLRVAADGDLLIEANGGVVRQHLPVVYQTVGKSQKPIKASYKVTAKNEVAFQVGSYDRSRALVIDPVLSYSTYLGGFSNDEGRAIAVDGSGRACITGYTSSGFPTKNPAQTNQPGLDVFVTKMWATGGGLIYSTYLGGSKDDLGTGISADRFSNVYVTGRTSSTDFPTTTNAFQKTAAPGQRAFVTKLDPTGKVVFSTYLSGTGISDDALAVTVDSQQRVYVVGETNSADFPVKNPYQATMHGSSDGFLTRLDSDGASLSYSTYFGGTEGSEGIEAVTVDSTYHAYITGATSSQDFPITTGSFETRRPAGGFMDAFVTKFTAAGTGLLYSTYLGGSGSDEGRGIAVDSSGRAYVTGTAQSMDFPTTPGAFQTHNGGQAGGIQSDAFVSRLNAAGTALSYSTYIGGNSIDDSLSIAVDSSGQAVITGVTNSQDFPLKNAFQTSGTAFLLKLNNTGSGLVYSTKIGGVSSDPSGNDAGCSVRLDGSGKAYVTGVTRSNTMPTTAGAFDRTFNGKADAFVIKISD